MNENEVGNTFQQVGPRGTICLECGDISRLERGGNPREDAVHCCKCGRELRFCEVGIDEAGQLTQFLTPVSKWLRRQTRLSADRSAKIPMAYLAVARETLDLRLGLLDDAESSGERRPPTVRG